MPRVPRSKAITTRDSIAAIWALAEAEGQVLLFPKTRQEAFLIRNKLYSYRSKERNSAYAHTGIKASHLDSFVINYGELPTYPGPIPPDVHPKSWFLRISRDDILEFIIARPTHPSPGGPVDDFVYIADPSPKRSKK